MKRAILGMFAITAVFLLTAPVYAEQGWKKTEDGKYWYELDYGGERKSYYHDGCFEIDGKWYSFDSDGYMQTGWKEEGENWYYFDPGSGTRVEGLTSVDGKIYYLDPYNNGAMWRGKIELDGKQYYFGEDGAAKTGFFLVITLPEEPKLNYYYYAEDNGVILRDTRKDDPNNNRTMLFESDGRILYRTETMAMEGKGFIYLTEATGGKGITYEDYYAKKANEIAEKEEKDREARIKRCLSDAFNAYKKNYIYLDQGKIDAWRENTRNNYIAAGGDEESLTKFFGRVGNRTYGASLSGSLEKSDIDYYGIGCFKNAIYHRYPSADGSITERERRREIDKLMNISLSYLSVKATERFFNHLKYGNYVPSYDEYYFNQH